MPRQRYSVDLPSFMADCDANYLRVSKLLPPLEVGGSCRLSIVLGGQEQQLDFTVQERSRYTSDVSVSEVSTPALHPLVPPLSLRIRLYHDARSAEVLDYQERRGFWSNYRYPNSHMYQPDEKAQINRYLAELLSICLRHAASMEIADKSGES